MIWRKSPAKRGRAIIATTLNATVHRQKASDSGDISSLTARATIGLSAQKSEPIQSKKVAEPHNLRASDWAVLKNILSSFIRFTLFIVTNLNRLALPQIIIYVLHIAHRVVHKQRRRVSSPMNSTSNLVDTPNATQSRLVFWDDDIYRQELERIFARSWLFLGHESLLPKPGDFLTTYMAQDKVILSHQPDGSFRAFLNSCTHRGNQICHADSGNAKAFVCNYHGWAFGQDGSLKEAPLESRCYHDELDKSELGLKQVRVASYKGFIFGCHDPLAPGLEEYLGDFCWYLDAIWEGAGGGMELIGPPMKSLLNCNWKIPTENFIGDAYHVGWTHAAALEVIGGELAGLAGNSADMPFDDMGLQFTTRHGHGFGLIDNAAASIHSKREGYVKFLEETREEVGRKLGSERERLYMGHWNASIFPNCSFLYGTNTFKIWHPRGPHQIEVWTYTMVPSDADDATKHEIQRQASRTFGTAGTLESDDGENMTTATFSNQGWVTRQGRMNSSMGIGKEGPHPVYPGIVGSSFIGETSYRGFYSFWSEMMEASDWDAVRANDEHWEDSWASRDFWSEQ